MGIGGVRSNGKLSCWDGVLERGVGAVPSLRGGILHFGKPPVQRRSTPMLWPLPSEDQSKGEKLVRIWQKTVVKIYLAEKTLQLIGVLRE
jgi:hypothetical protein